jgi:plasmid stability protein
MSTITIHQLEPDIAQQLEQRAAQHGRTIEL